MRSHAIMIAFLFLCARANAVDWPASIEANYRQRCPNSGSSNGHLSINTVELTYERRFIHCGQRLYFFERGTLEKGDRLKKTATAVAIGAGDPDWIYLDTPSASGYFQLGEGYVLDYDEYATDPRDYVIEREAEHFVMN